MEMHPGLSIIVAALGGILIGWQLRAEFEQWRRRRRDVQASRAKTDAEADAPCVRPINPHPSLAASSRRTRDLT